MSSFVRQIQYVVFEDTITVAPLLSPATADNELVCTPQSWRGVTTCSQQLWPRQDPKLFVPLSRLLQQSPPRLGACARDAAWSRPAGDSFHVTTAIDGNHPAGAVMQQEVAVATIAANPYWQCGLES